MPVGMVKVVSQRSRKQKNEMRKKENSLWECYMMLKSNCAPYLHYYSSFTLPGQLTSLKNVEPKSQIISPWELIPRIVCRNRSVLGCVFRSIEMKVLKRKKIFAFMADSNKTVHWFHHLTNIFITKIDENGRNMKFINCCMQVFFLCLQFQE